MSIEETNRLDMLVRTPEGEIGLVMTAFKDWGSEPDLLQKLSEKIGVYVSYSKSREFKREHGNEPVKIILSTQHNPTPEVQALLDDAADATGIPFEVMKLPGFDNPLK